MNNLFANEVTIKELINLMMKDDQKVCCDGTIFTALRAVSFRIPKRPIYCQVTGPTCSNCAEPLNEEAHNFCPHCGLAINWDEN